MKKTFTFFSELVTPKIGDQIENPKPGTLGCNTTWQRLKREYSKAKHVINSHMSQIINLPLTKSTNIQNVQ